MKFFLLLLGFLHFMGHKKGLQKIKKHVIFYVMMNTDIFQINQKVVYPSQGVGKIVSIEEKSFKDTKVPYYVIYLESSDMKIMVPVDKADELGLRAIVSEQEALAAINFMSEDYAPPPADWKLRYQMNIELLKRGSIHDIATIVRLFYHRSKLKELPIMERKLYDAALKILQDEVSYALDKPRGEVETLIFEKLEWTPLKLVEQEDEHGDLGLEDEVE